MEKGEKLVGLLRFEKPKNIHSEWDNGGRIELTFVKRLEDGKIRNFTSSCWSDDDGMLFHFPELTIRCLFSVKNREIDSLGFFGWQVEYQDAYSMDLGRTERMVKTLQKISKKLEAIRAEWGMPDSFGDYALRIMKAVGAAGVVKRGDKVAGTESWGYDDSEWLLIELKDLKSEILWLISDYQEEIKEKVVAVGQV